MKTWICLIGLAASLGAAVATSGWTAVAQTRDPRTVKELMKEDIAPAADVIFNYVAIDVTLAGVVENAPKTDAEWAEVRKSAVALADSGAQLKAQGRGREYDKLAQEMTDAALLARRAADTRNVSRLRAAEQAMNAACENCHQKYWPRSDQQPNGR
ncbi:MAG: hypothetical protein A3G76_00570 [Acidobacteria bacterium RIFCSPLOWO2_12_FULL_65_11]|nr:MAG: hypothetical protein A3H95_06895 [Acidobacteria bacterium RIFCSPLOWO2_02_FULL_64_15]OFW34156.1 MAG: hypothetical protein A3G76_00570 [Acidobacteria bacterium RIFCSPLOWO2_12_FULL_65_11]